MKIAHIAPLFQPIPPEGYGGTEICIANLAVEQVAQGNDVTVFASGDSTLLEYAKNMLSEQGYEITDSEGEYFEKSIIVNSDMGISGQLNLVPVIEKAHGYNTPYTTTPKLKAAHMALERETDFDVINSHINLVDLPIWEAKGLEHKVVTTLHYGVNNDIYPFYPNANSICISQDQAELAETLGVKSLGVAHHGLPKNQYIPNLEETSSYLAFLGHMGEEKGLERAVEIARQAGKPLVIAGKIRPQDQERWNREFADRVTSDPTFLENPNQDLENDAIIFVGEIGVEGKQKLLANAEALLFPISWREPFGMVMIEANACGTPVIGFSHFENQKCGSVDEIIQEGVNGFKATSVAEAVQKIELVDSLSREGVYADFCNRFHMNRVAKEYQAIYSKMLDKQQKIDTDQEIDPDKDYLKISFCTTCMGRLEDLKQTLPKNIADNRDYPNVEFVVLDYNSDDGLGEWIQENFQEEMDSGLLRYVRTEEPEHWKMSHAKNMAHRAATGDVLVNMDADNFAGKGMAFWLNDAFSENPNIVVRPDINYRRIPGNESTAGRIAISKENFLKIRGYDEARAGWGKEDTKLIDSAARLGIKWKEMPPAFLANSIQQSDEQRVEHYAPDEKELSLQAINQTRHRNIADKMGRNVERFVDRVTANVNPSGAFGCGTVYINFSDTPEMIAPVFIERSQHKKNINPALNLAVGR